MKKFFITSVFLGISLFALAGGGNTKTSDIQGVVTDKQGNPLVGAKVYLQAEGKTVYTDFDGKFTLSEVSRTEQQVKVSHISFEDAVELINPKQTDSKFLTLELRSK